ncbi:MAG: DUF748 domain-containing protein [Bacteroidota bacterium]
MQKLKKTLLVLITTILITCIVVVVFISSIAKYVVEKYDEKYTGRQITLDWAYVNLFTGYVYIHDLKIYEFENPSKKELSDSLFFSAKSLVANVSMLKLFYKTYEISEITLNNPYGIVIQNKKDFNFNDLITKFSSKENADINKPPVHFNLLKIKIKNGEFHYREVTTPISYFIKNVNIDSEGLYWNVDTIATKFSFQSGLGTGDINGNFTINTKNKDYNLALLVKKLNLSIVEQYLKDLSNDGSLSATLDANIKSSGNFVEKENVTNSGTLAINDFHFGKTPIDDYVSFKKLVIAVKEISPKKHIYYYDSIALTQPYFKYERYDSLDNVQTMFGKKGATIKAAKDNAERFNLLIEIANYIKILSKNFFESNYKINKLAIYNGDLKYNDYALNEKFSVELNPFFVLADSIDKKHNRVKVVLKSGIKPYGNFWVNLSINPKDSSDFDMQYNLQKLPLAMFNPYTISLTSFPFDRGMLEFNGVWNVRNGNIKSTNHLVIIDPRVGERIKNKGDKWIPMRVIMALVREFGNVIDYEIPITGDLKNPKFHLKDVLFDVAENIFVKPAKLPYRVKVKNIETEIEDALTLKWETKSSNLFRKQEKFSRKMANYLADNPDAFIYVYPQQFTAKEKEYILFFEAKKKYFKSKNAGVFSYKDSIAVEKMSVKEPLFVSYLNKHSNYKINTIQEKCFLVVDSALINNKFNLLNKQREKVFIASLKNKAVEKQVKIYAGKSVVPYNGFSFYKITYKADLPDDLIKAYKDMNDLNNEAPRNKFKKDRKKNENVF